MGAAVAAVCSFPPSPRGSRLSVTARARRGCCRCSAVRRDTGPDTPPLLRGAVSVVTEILRVVSPKKSRPVDDREEEGEENGEVEIRCVEDVVSCLKRDYERSYFVTGNFSSGIYSKNCLFEDPTISFRGREQYSRNLELLVPFFDSPSLTLEKIEKSTQGDIEFVIAAWKLRTYLKLPWRPYISVDGSTKYYLNTKFQVVRHVESWNISALAAIVQIFTAS